MSDTMQGTGWWKASDGKWYPPQPGPQGPQPQQVVIVQKKGGFGRGCLTAIGAAVVAVVGLIVILLLVVGGSKSSSTPGSGTSAHPAAADVSIACAATDTVGFMHSNVTVTNHSSQRSNYIITISFDNANGNRLQEGTATENDVAPGQTASTDGIGDGTTGGTPSACVVASVTRLAA